MKKSKNGGHVFSVSHTGCWLSANWLAIFRPVGNSSYNSSTLLLISIIQLQASLYYGVLSVFAFNKPPWSDLANQDPDDEQAGLGDKKFTSTVLHYLNFSPPLSRLLKKKKPDETFYEATFPCPISVMHVCNSNFA